jgi:DNA-binding transcriptional LysR family regulator
MNGWMGVELRHLAALAAVAEEQSFRAAAERLGYVQSAVSQRIAQLEIAVGARLVDRSRGHKDVNLTEAGATLLRHAERIDAHLGAARAELHELADDTGSANLKVGASGGAAARLVPRALARVSQRSPDLRIELRESPSDGALFEAVDTGELDVAIAELPLERGPYESQIALVDPLVALVPSGSQLTNSTSMPTLAQLASEPFVVNANWRMFDLVEAELAASGLDVDVRFRSISGAALQSLVAAGLGIAIVPRLDVDFSDPATEAIDLRPTLPSRTLVSFWSPERSRSDGVIQFLEAIDAACEDYRWSRSDHSNRLPARQASLAA